MDCNETKRLLDAYTDDELELTRMLHVEAHLAACSACNKAAEAAINFRYSVRMNTPLYKAPPKLKAKIRVALRKESKSSWIFQFRRTLFYALAGLSVVDCDITMRGPSEDLQGKHLVDRSRPTVYKGSQHLKHHQAPCRN